MKKDFLIFLALLICPPPLAGATDIAVDLQTYFPARLGATTEFMPANGGLGYIAPYCSIQANNYGTPLPDDMSLCLNPRFALSNSSPTIIQNPNLFYHCAALVTITGGFYEDATPSKQSLFATLDPIGNSVLSGLVSQNSCSETTPSNCGARSLYTLQQTPTATLQTCNGPNVFKSPPDTYDVIARQDAGGSRDTGAIWLPTNVGAVINPWWGSSSSTKQAGCFNINELVRYEDITIGDLTDATHFIVPHCIPAINSSYKALYKFGYDPTLHSSWVMDQATIGGSLASNEHIDPVSDTAGNVVRKTLLQVSPSDRTDGSTTQLGELNRGIWGCQYGFDLDKTNRTCTWNADKNLCNRGDGAGIPASAVGADVYTTSTVGSPDQFDHVLNRKLACCTTNFIPGYPGLGDVKLDCLESPAATVTDFNTQWSSIDLKGNMNAVYLVDPLTAEPLTGFFTKEFVRCDGFSEFTNDSIRPAKVNPLFIQGLTINTANHNNGPDQIEFLGAEIAKPTASSDWTNLVTNLGSSNAHAPSLAVDRRRCPYLMRAAMISFCPETRTPGSNAINNVYEEVISGQTYRHCQAAKEILIALHFEQVTSIAGENQMKPWDTLLEWPTTSRVSIAEILSSRNGTSCPAGSTYNVNTNECDYSTCPAGLYVENGMCQLTPTQSSNASLFNLFHQQ